MEHNFNGPSYTIGIEEELMIVDDEMHELVNAIEDLLRDAPEGDIKPELMESVLEIATPPCKDIPHADKELRRLRDSVRQLAGKHGLMLGRRAPIHMRCGRSSGSPPAPATANWSRHCASWRARS